MSIANEIQRLQSAKADIKTAIENKGVTVGDGTIDTYAEKIGEISASDSGDYDQGYEDGYNVGSMPIYCSGNVEGLISGAVLPENTHLVLRVKNMPYAQNNAFMQTTNLKSVKLICETQYKDGVWSMSGFVRESPQLEFVDLTEWGIKPNNISYFALNSNKLKTILGAFDLSNCTNVTMAFNSAKALEDIEFVPNTIKISISFSHSAYLTDKSIQSIIDGLADLTGGTAQTLTLHATVGGKLTDEQKAMITSKNWTLVY